MNFVLQQPQQLEDINSNMGAIKLKLEVMPTTEDIVNDHGFELTDASPEQTRHFALQQRTWKEVPYSQLILLEDEYSNALKRLESDDFVSSLQSAKRVLDITQTLFGEESERLAYSYSLIGLIQGESGDYASAIQSLQHSLNIKQDEKLDAES
ncbi:hypothetical protein AWC38_SpisGene20086 [Stylophora pistillata]|uniref:Uncharacterized protein n=1 Tax=Stylophora pistillata TaxID=50429 RepID=A0A2B4RDH4_STYPI|nr:hypothetical protein AWC38_SpisGene20086 [Stylophora pistillata]